MCGIVKGMLRVCCRFGGNRCCYCEFSFGFVRVVCERFFGRGLVLDLRVLMCSVVTLPFLLYVCVHI